MQDIDGVRRRTKKPRKCTHHGARHRSAGHEQQQRPEEQDDCEVEEGPDFA